MMPIVHGLEDEFRDRIAVVRLDVADRDNEAFQRGLGLRGHPAIAILDAEGRLAASFLGPQPADALRDELATLLEP